MWYGKCEIIDKINQIIYTDAQKKVCTWLNEYFVYKMYLSKQNIVKSGISIAKMYRQHNNVFLIEILSLAKFGFAYKNRWVKRKSCSYMIVLLLF